MERREQEQKRPEPKTQYQDRDYFAKPQVPDRSDKGGEGDFSGSSAGGERWAGRTWSGGRGR